MKRVLLGVVAAALLVLTLPAAAVAQTRVHIDPANDIVGGEDGDSFHPQPGSGPDIRKVVFTHGHRFIWATVYLAPVADPIPYRSGDWRPAVANFYVTNGRHQILEVFAADGRVSDVYRYTKDLRHRHRKHVACRGVRVTWHQSSRTVSMKLPRSCAQNPRYVQLAVEVNNIANSDPTVPLPTATLTDNGYSAAYVVDVNYPKIRAHSRWTKRG